MTASNFIFRSIPSLKNFPLLFIILTIPIFKVYGNEVDVPTSVTILTQEDFLGRPYTSVADVLENVTSINIEKEGYKGSRSVGKIRGLTSNQTQILMDGESLSNEFNATVDLSQVPLFIVDRIEISRSGASVAYPTEGAGGTINIVTLKPTEKGMQTRLGTGIGRYGAKHAYGQFLGRSYWGDLSYLGNTENSGGFLTNEGSNTTNHFGKIARSFNGKGYWELNYIFHESDIGLAQGTPVPLEEWNEHLEKLSANSSSQKKQEFQKIKFALGSPRLFGGNLYLNSSLSWRQLQYLSSPSQFALFDQKNESVKNHLKWVKNNFETGINSENKKGRVVHLDTKNISDFSAYLLNKWKKANWVLIPGFRVGHLSRGGDYFDPRIALTCFPSASWTVSSTWQQLHRAPQINELFFSTHTIQNGELDLEKAFTGDIGIRWTPKDNFEANLTGFISHQKDIIGLNSTTGQLDNFFKKRSKGVEGGVRSELGNGLKYRHITLLANLTTLKSESSNTAGSGYSESALTPKTWGTFEIQQHLPRSLTFSNKIYYQSAQYEQNGQQGLKLPGYYQWDIRLSAKVLSAYIYTAVQNVSRRRTTDSLASSAAADPELISRYSPQASRTFWAGISIDFKN
jgi:outer membrane receptor for ferrienterochelin and colicin